MPQPFDGRLARLRCDTEDLLFLTKGGPGELASEKDRGEYEEALQAGLQKVVRAAKKVFPGLPLM